MSIKLLIVGASGLVGQQVLAQALASPDIEQIIAPTRHTLEKHSKLYAPIIDFEQVPVNAEWWQVDAVICTLGSTISKAGSKEKFYRIDHDYPLMTAQLAKQHGASTYVLTSAIGANTNSRFFYNKVKGELEQDLLQENFQSLTIVRPGVIGGQRQEFRLGERALGFSLSVLAPILPKRLQINPAHKIAETLLDAAIKAQPGVHLVSADKLA